MNSGKKYTALAAVLFTGVLLCAIVWLFSFEKTSKWLNQQGLHFSNLNDFREKKADTLIRRSIAIKPDTLTQGLTAAEKSVIDSLSKKVSFLENYSFEDGQMALDKFFASLSATADSVVHIWYYGDSQVEGDRITQDLRPLLQKEFGGNGIGFLPFSDVATYRDFETETSENWTKLNVFINRKSRGFGFSGIKFRIKQKDSTEEATTVIKSRYGSAFPAVSLLYGNTSGGKVEVINDGKKEEKEAIAWSKEEGAGIIKISSGFRKSLQLKFDDRESDFFGYLISGRNGIYIDNCGIRGHSGDGLFNISNTMLKTHARMMNTKLVVFHYGNNAIPYIKSKQHAEFVGKEFERLFNRFRQALPQVSFLVVSGGDMGRKIDENDVPYEYAQLLAQTIGEAANRSGCAFFDMYSMMKKDGGIKEWKRLGLANLDGHLSPAGQARFAKVLYSELMREYSIFKVIHKRN